MAENAFSGGMRVAENAFSDVKFNFLRKTRKTNFPAEGRGGNAFSCVNSNIHEKASC